MSKITTKILLVLTCGVLLIAACGEMTPKTEPLEERDALHFSEVGKIVTKASIAVLSKQLQEAVKTGGTLYALSYCNTAALALTDSISRSKQVQIRRTSLKLRNPKNTPTPWELEQLMSYQSDFNDGKALSPVVKRLENGTIIYMEPILITAFCLQCHGDPIFAVDEKLKELYPQDKAIGYEEGDFRGIWAVKLR